MPSLFSVSSTLILILLTFHTSFAKSGDAAFSHMIDAAILDKKQDIEKSLKKISFPYVLLHDCIDGSEYSYPNKGESDKETLNQVLASKKLKVGISKTNGMKNPSLEIMESIARGISSNYGVEVKAEIVNYDTEYSVLAALKNETIDVAAPSLIIAPQALDKRRRLSVYKVSCSVGALQMGFYTYFNVGDVESLLSQASAQNLKFIVSNKDDGDLIANYYDVAYVIAPVGFTIASMKDDTSLAAYFSSSTIDISSAVDLHYIKHPFVFPVSLVVRQESTFDLINKKPETYFEGNSDLRALIDYSASKYQMAGARKATFANEEIMLNGDCSPAEPKPDALVAGTLAAILGTEKFYVGYPQMEIAPILDTLNFDEKTRNQIREIESEFVKYISEKYEKKIEIVPTTFPSIESLFNALGNGTIDATTAAIPLGISSASGYPYHWGSFEHGCSALAWSLTFVFNPTNYPNIGSYDDFLEEMKVATKKVVTSSDLVFKILQASFSTAYLEIIHSPIEAIKKLDSKDYIAYVVDPPSNFPSGASVADYVLIVSPQTVPTGMFFRRDRIATVAPVTTQTKQLTILFVILIITVVLLWVIATLVVCYCCGCFSCSCCSCSLCGKKAKKYDKFESVDDDKDYAPPSIAF